MSISKFGVNTGSYDGYTLEEAMANMASLGFKKIEIAAVTGWTEHIIPERMTLSDFKKVNQLLQEYNLNAPSFSGHVDLGKSDSIDKFRKRIDFAEYIGASVINSFTTAPENIDFF